MRLSLAPFVSRRDEMRQVHACGPNRRQYERKRKYPTLVSATSVKSDDDSAYGGGNVETTRDPTDGRARHVEATFV